MHVYTLIRADLHLLLSFNSFTEKGTVIIVHLVCVEMDLFLSL